MTSREKRFRDFADFAAKLKGDEKSEAQTFLFHLLESFGAGQKFFRFLPLKVFVQVELVIPHKTLTKDVPPDTGSNHNFSGCK